jgi:ACR3 family arsenite transporter
MGFLDRFLAIWIFLAMLIGILLGNFVEGVGPALQKGTFVDVSLPIGMSLPLILISHTPANADTAIGLLVMMYPILCKVEYEKLHKVFQTREIWVQMGFSIIINWIIAPLLMVGHPWRRGGQDSGANTTTTARPLLGLPPG